MFPPRTKGERLEANLKLRDQEHKDKYSNRTGKSTYFLIGLYLGNFCNSLCFFSFLALFHRELQQRRLPEHELTYKRVQ